MWVSRKGSRAFQAKGPRPPAELATISSPARMQGGSREKNEFRLDVRENSTRGFAGLLGSSWRIDGGEKEAGRIQVVRPGRRGNPELVYTARRQFSSCKGLSFSPPPPAATATQTSVHSHCNL